MNERGVEVLVGAAMRGAKQITGDYRDDGDGRCAYGVLASATPGVRVTRQGTFDANDVPTREPTTALFGLRAREMFCPECDDRKIDEHDLIAHLNDDHGWDFLTIARKLGPATEG